MIEWQGIHSRALIKLLILTSYERPGQLIEPTLHYLFPHLCLVDSVCQNKYEHYIFDALGLV